MCRVLLLVMGLTATNLFVKLAALTMMVELELEPPESWDVGARLHPHHGPNHKHCTAVCGDVNNQQR